MSHLKFGLMIVGLTVAAHAAAGEESFFVSRLDQSTIQFVHSDTDFIPPYRFTASVVLTRPADIAPVGSGFGSTSQLSSISDPKKESVRPANASWQQTSGDVRASLSHLMRVEFQGEQFKLTLRPGSATMEQGQFKVILRNGSTSMMWRMALQ